MDFTPCLEMFLQSSRSFRANWDTNSVQLVLPWAVKENISLRRGVYPFLLLVVAKQLLFLIWRIGTLTSEYYCDLFGIMKSFHQIFSLILNKNTSTRIIIKHQFNMNSWLWLSLFCFSELFSHCRRLFPMYVAGSGTTVLTEGYCVPCVTWQLPVTHSYCHLN